MRPMQDPFHSFISVTQQGGTPNYMGPELFNGSRVDEKCDVSSLAVWLFGSLTGRVVG